MMKQTLVYKAPRYVGKHDRKYKFDIVLTEHGWRSYLRSMPLCDRPMNTVISHLMADDNQSQYFLVWDMKVSSLDDMVRISKYWADEMQKYIETGVRFGGKYEKSTWVSHLIKNLESIWIKR